MIVGVVAAPPGRSPGASITGPADVPCRPGIVAINAADEGAPPVRLLILCVGGKDVFGSLPIRLAGPQNDRRERRMMDGVRE